MLQIVMVLSCFDGFELEDDKCVCKQLLSSNKSKCVSNCNSLNEIEKNGKCVKLQIKQLNEFCMQDSECQSQEQICISGNCQCDTENGYFDNNSGSCITCSHIVTIFNKLSSQCECDESNGYITTVNPFDINTQVMDWTVFESSKSYCTKCWSINQIVVDHKCKYCDNGLIFKDNQCKCDSSIGSIRTPNPFDVQTQQTEWTDFNNSNPYCTNCWESNLIILYDFCTSCSKLSALYDQTTHSCLCDNSQGYAGQSNTECIDCWSQNQTVQNNICEPCGVGSVFKINKCVCDEQWNWLEFNGKCINCELQVAIGTRLNLQTGQCECSNQIGYVNTINPYSQNMPEWAQFEATKTMCTSCYYQEQIVVNGMCSSCAQGTVFWPVKCRCICDEALGFTGFNANECVNCWSQNQIIDYDNKQCLACDPGTKVVNNQCVCDELQGYIENNTLCVNCWAENKIASQGSCKACPSGSKFDVDQCTCDESLGYSGQDPENCDNCWQHEQIVFQNKCQSCIVGQIFLNNECVCDELSGYVGMNPQICEDCWSKSMVVSNSKCVQCTDLDQFSIYEMENLCKCEVNYKLNNEICQKIKRNQTIAIAICVPIVVIIITIILVVLILKKRQKNKQNSDDTTKQSIKQAISVVSEHQQEEQYNQIVI
ncbi:Growth_factor receptor cysteine-rich domain superfamily [Hexamita inflata]|uniref:Growth factor receptor cysteine-rich domain superfamily n=1 Tax=Hexamita inflata TaxID=28002 RepID=A0AA86UMR8_9EUKA|nr:Growth factor receptor cysteine-rich domain superfamily [Hexamita inflata]